MTDFPSLSTDGRRAEFPTAGPVRVRARNAAGHIALTAAGSGESRVEVRALDPAAQDLVEATRIELRDAAGGQELVVEVPPRHGLLRRAEDVSVEIAVPENSSLSARTASADVSTSGRLGELVVKTASGDVSAAAIAGGRVATASGDVDVDGADGDLGVDTASGDVSVGRAGGRLNVHTASGTVRVREATGRLEVHSASGQVQAGALGGDATLRTASGDLTVERARQGTVALTAMSGDITIGVEAGTAVQVDAVTRSGQTTSQIPLYIEPAGDGPTLRVQARTMSGDVRLLRAEPAVG